MKTGGLFSRRELKWLAAVSAAAALSWASGFDYWLAEAVSDRAAHGISLFFSSWYYAAYMLAAFAFTARSDWRGGAALAASIAALGALKEAFSILAFRPRPPQAMPVGDGLMRIIQDIGASTSFFSGHTAGVVAAVTVCMFLGMRWRFAAALGLPIIVSRITLAQHYPSDVLGGVVFGYGAAKAACAAVFGRHRGKGRAG
jgi:membrane-associated phospholipid phosphatase